MTLVARGRVLPRYKNVIITNQGKMNTVLHALSLSGINLAVRNSALDTMNIHEARK